jgi:hypothetical protein
LEQSRWQPPAQLVSVSCEVFVDIDVRMDSTHLLLLSNLG